MGKCSVSRAWRVLCNWVFLLLLLFPWSHGALASLSEVKDTWNRVELLPAEARSANSQLNLRPVDEPSQDQQSYLANLQLTPGA